MFSYFVYILASGKNGTLYTGVANNLIRRVFEHKHKLHKGFSETYNITKLVYFEETDNIFEAIHREKQIKRWNRKWKLELIENFNAKWKDLYYDYGGKEFEEGIDINEYKDQLLDSRLRGNDKAVTPLRFFKGGYRF